LRFEEERQIADTDAHLQGSQDPAFRDTLMLANSNMVDIRGPSFNCHAMMVKGPYGVAPAHVTKCSGTTSGSSVALEVSYRGRDYRAYAIGTLPGKDCISFVSQTKDSLISRILSNTSKPTK